MTKEDSRHADKNHRIIVVGAGAGGLIAAGRAAELGADVLLLEKTERPGKKILISGKTRCNLSNTKSLKDFIPMYGENGPFLYSAFHHFFHDCRARFRPLQQAHSDPWGSDLAVAGCSSSCRQYSDQKHPDDDGLYFSSIHAGYFLQSSQIRGDA